MSEIAHYTFNPWQFSMGCCVVASEASWRGPLKWNRDAESAGERRRVLVRDAFEEWDGRMRSSRGLPLERSILPFVYWRDNTQTFGPEDGHGVTMNDVRRRLFALIDATPNLDWLLLTDQPQNIRRLMPCRYENVWLGTSADTQETADKNIPELLKCDDLAPVLFVSCEPMLGPVDLRDALGLTWEKCGACGRRYPDVYWGADYQWEAVVGDTYAGLRCPDCFRTAVSAKGMVPLLKYLAPPLARLNWVICGGESDHNARPMHPDWARSLRDQCVVAGVPFFFTQWGAMVPVSQVDDDELHAGAIHRMTSMQTEDSTFLRVGKKAAGRLLDGREWNELPTTGRTL